MNKCNLCPRECNIDREKSLGACTAPGSVKVARAALHHWEEPPISGSRGSGTVFFSGCPLGCVFCQNREISRGGVGREISVSRLAEIFGELERQGAHNINLVSPTQYTTRIIKALEIAKPTVPVAVNTGGYEKAETVRLWEGHASVFLPDLKCQSSDISRRYMGAADYFKRAMEAILEMHKLAPKLEYNDDGTLKAGLIVRHLVLPGCSEDSIRVLEALGKNLPAGSFLLSLMSQFTPNENCRDFPEINRRVTTYEYEKVLKHALRLGLDGFRQGRDSAKSAYTPPFDLTGV